MKKFMQKYFASFFIFILSVPLQTFAEICPADTIWEQYVEININDEVKVYPVPLKVGQDLKFVLAQEECTSIQVEITDLMGQVLVKNKITHFAPFVSDIQLKPGSYLIKINIGERIIIRRIIVSV